MSTLQSTDKKQYRGVNPIIRKVGKATKIADKESSISFSGITIKTIIILVSTAVGFGGYYGFSKYLAFGDTVAFGNFTTYLPQFILAFVSLLLVVIAPFIAWHIRNILKYASVIFALAQGIFIAWFTKTFAGEFKEIIVLSLIATFALIITLLMLYKHKIVNPKQKVKFVALAVVLTAVITTVVLFIAYFVPGARPYVDTISNHSAATFGVSIVLVVLAALLLLCDYKYIEKRVNNRLHEKYEWLISFGLGFNVVWIYLKIFDLPVKTK